MGNHCPTLQPTEALLLIVRPIPTEQCQVLEETLCKGSVCVCVQCLFYPHVYSFNICIETTSTIFHISQL